MLALVCVNVGSTSRRAGTGSTSRCVLGLACVNVGSTSRRALALVVLAGVCWGWRVLALVVRAGVCWRVLVLVLNCTLALYDLACAGVGW